MTAKIIAGLLSKHNKRVASFQQNSFQRLGRLESEPREFPKAGVDVFLSQKTAKIKEHWF
jgi:hypothetical protein